MEIKRQPDATGDIYCRFYCMLNMFRTILCPSSGAREYYTDGRCLWYLVLWFSSCRYDVELKVMCLYNTLELLMMGIVLSETCWACNKICNKYHLLHLVGVLFPHINDDARSESLQIFLLILPAVLSNNSNEIYRIYLINFSDVKYNNLFSIWVYSAIQLFSDTSGLSGELS